MSRQPKRMLSAVSALALVLTVWVARSPGVVADEADAAMTLAPAGRTAEGDGPPRRRRRRRRGRRGSRDGMPVGAPGAGGEGAEGDSGGDVGADATSDSDTFEDDGPDHEDPSSTPDAQ